MHAVRHLAHSIRHRVVAILAMIAALGSGASARSLEMPCEPERRPDIDSTRQETSALPRLPLEFEENRGQAAPGVRFLVAGSDLQTAILSDRVCFAVAGAPVPAPGPLAAAAVSGLASDAWSAQAAGRGPARGQERPIPSPIPQ